MQQNVSRSAEESNGFSSMLPVMLVSDHQSSVRRLDQHAPPHLQLTDSMHSMSSSSRGDTAAATVMPSVMLMVAPSDDKPKAGELHLPVIPSYAAAPSKRLSTDTSKTGRRGSSVVAGESALTTALMNSSPSSSRVHTVDDPPPCLLTATSTSTGTSLAYTKCSQLLSTDVIDDSMECGVSNGRRKSKEVVRTGGLPVASLDDVRRTSPRVAAQVRDRRRQNGFRGDDERVIRNRLTRSNRTTMSDDVYITSAAFGATKNETDGGTRYSGNVVGARLCRYRPEVSVNGPVCNTTADVAASMKNRLPGQFRSCAVRPRQPVSNQSSVVETAVHPMSVRRVESVTRPCINTRQTAARQERPVGGQTSAAADDDEEVTAEKQRQRVIDWLNSVGDYVERPQSAHIDEYPTPMQTDTAIHIVYDKD